MKNINIVFSRTELSYAVSLAAKVVSSYNTSAESLIFIEGKNDGAAISASNGINSIKITVKADVINEGKVGVPGRLFNETVKRISADEITFTQEEKQQVLIGYLGGEIKLPAMDFKALTLTKPDADFLIEHKDFKSLIEITQNFVSKTNERPVLKGVNLKTSGSELIVTACDGFRIAEARYTLKTNPGNDVNIIVPVDGLRLILQATTKDEPLKISVSKSVLYFTQSAVEISTVLLSGDYPINVKRLIPNSCTTVSRAEKSALINSIERTMLFATEQARVDLAISDKSISVNATGNVGELSDIVTASTEGKDLDISFNGGYLLEILKVIQNEEVIVKCNKETQPAIFEDGERVFILLPIMRGVK
ncbi:MAG: DNA polymerase III subunit beta [Candidatus Coproplasma sp.]